MRQIRGNVSENGKRDETASTQMGKSPSGSKCFKEFITKIMKNREESLIFLFFFSDELGNYKTNFNWVCLVAPTRFKLGAGFSDN